MSVGGGARAQAQESSNHYSFLRDSQPYPNSTNFKIQMATLPFFLSLFIFLLILPYTTSNPVCDSWVSCGIGSPSVEFPFWLRDSSPSKSCGYPGFELFCDKNRTLLNIPNAGNFVVRSMSSQHILIYDTDGCLPRRFLAQNVSLEGTPFRWGNDYTLVNLTFLKCSNLVDRYPLEYVPCLSSSYNSNVFIMFPNEIYDNEQISSCQLISSASVPLLDWSPLTFMWDFDSDIELKWSEPDCSKCNPYSEKCGPLGNTCLVTCYPTYTSPSIDSSPGLAIGKTLGIGVAALMVCFILSQLVLSLTSLRQLRQASLDLPTSNAPQPTFYAVTTLGLDRSIVETYPKIEVSESGALPDPNDNVCPICLSEYKTKETLRIIPNCSHYFHLKCLDEWLKINASCPLCRN